MAWFDRLLSLAARTAHGPRLPALTAPDERRQALMARYATPPFPGLSYATVRDYCDSADQLPELATRHYDLKDVQRPWTVKAVLNSMKSGHILEIGSGEPLAAAVLASLGFQVTVCDPFDGSGNGPTEYLRLRACYPTITFIRSLFVPEVARQFAGSIDCVLSISVLEHVPPGALSDLFQAIRIALKPGGSSIHAIDHVMEGNGAESHAKHLAEILIQQEAIAGNILQSEAARSRVDGLSDAARQDLETYYLSAHGHNLWRGSTPYDQFPFRRCISVNSIVRNGLG